ncbi:hypothetical protein RJ639_008066 [Escallonia herrerae]|uniref:Uncharacterized protein n=1 Tax=Escallonia herrerae TaxID=1293975 RepID=A0AA88VUU1_9ASTE|nr:hypothetical protein RJ639_008066 [Escallonia herrerae]
MAMKRSAIETVFLCCVIFGMHISSSKDKADDSISPMERKEQEALYFVVEGFVGSWWNWMVTNPGGLTLSIQEMLSLEEIILANNPNGGNLMTIQWENMQNLVYLDLSSMGLTGSIPNSMTELKIVRFLGLDNNCLSGHIPLRFESHA